MKQARKLTGRIAGIHSDSDALAADEPVRFAWVNLGKLDGEREAIRHVYVALYSMNGISAVDARFIDEFGFRHFRNPEAVWPPPSFGRLGLQNVPSEPALRMAFWTNPAAGAWLPLPREVAAKIQEKVREYRERTSVRSF